MMHSLQAKGSGHLRKHSFSVTFLGNGRAVVRKGAALAHFRIKPSRALRDASVSRFDGPRQASFEPSRYQRDERSYPVDDAYQRSEPAGPGPQSQASRIRNDPVNGGSQLQRLPSYEDEAVQLRFVRDIKGKEVIAQEEGKKLGGAAGVLVDTSGMTVRALRVSDACVPLEDLRQIGDVVLVVDEQALRSTPRGRLFSHLLGLAVKDNYSGQSIGRVTEVEFDPDTGEITAVFYDTLQLAFSTPDLDRLRLKLFNLYGLPVEAIVQVSGDSIMVNQGAVWLESQGALDPFAGLLQGASAILGPGEQREFSNAVREWSERTGLTPDEWYEQYGDRYRAAASRSTAVPPRGLPAPREPAAAPRAAAAAPPAQRDVAAAYRAPRGAPAARASQRATPPSAGPAYADAPRRTARPAAAPEQGLRPRYSENGAYEGQQASGGDARPRGTVAAARAPPQQPLFRQYLIKDERERQYDGLQDAPRSRAAGDAIDPRDRSMQ